MKAAPAAVGFRVKSGWATGVLVAGPASAPRALDRRVVELSDPAVPTSRQPYHAVMSATGAASRRVEQRLLRVVTAAAQRSVRELLERYRHGARLAGRAVLRGGGARGVRSGCRAAEAHRGAAATRRYGLGPLARGALAGRRENRGPGGVDGAAASLRRAALGGERVAPRFPFEHRLAVLALHDDA